MFTLEAIKAAHSKVKSGADFPAYIRTIKALGVISYETYVTDGHINYHGIDHYTINAPARYAVIEIAGESDKDAFKVVLTAHQAGQSDFLTFIHQCAVLGIAKWMVAIDTMTCTYFDVHGDSILVEEIPV